MPATAFRESGVGLYTADLAITVHAVLRGTTFLFDTQGKPPSEVVES